MLPKSCQMPDLSHLDPLRPNLLTSVIGFGGETLSGKEKEYVLAFVRFTDKAISEYDAVRDYVIAQEKDRDQQGGQLFIFGIVNNMENCINTTKRLFGILKAAKSEKNRKLTIDKLLQKRIQTHYDSIKDIRSFIEHLDEKIYRGLTGGEVMISTTEDDRSIKIANQTIEFDALAQLLSHFHTLAVQWLDDYCKKHK